jgi:hypothetical protein
MRQRVIREAMLRVTLASLLLLAANGAAMPEGLKLIHTESVSQATFTGISFGPVGPGCDSSAGGSACLFLDVTANVVGQHNPFGKYTGTLGATLNLNPAHFIPSGATMPMATRPVYAHPSSAPRLTPLPTAAS